DHSHIGNGFVDGLVEISPGYGSGPVKRKNRLKIQLQPFNILHNIHSTWIDSGSIPAGQVLWSEHIGFNQNLFLRQECQEDAVIVRIPLDEVKLERTCAVTENLLVRKSLDVGFFL